MLDRVLENGNHDQGDDGGRHNPRALHMRSQEVSAVLTGRQPNCRQPTADLPIMRSRSNKNCATGRCSTQGNAGAATQETNADLSGKDSSQERASPPAVGILAGDGSRQRVVATNANTQDEAPEAYDSQSAHTCKGAEATQQNPSRRCSAHNSAQAVRKYRKTAASGT